MTLRNVLAVRSAGVVMLLLAVATAEADDRTAASIAEFMAARDQWDRRVGRPMRLEGRYTVFSSSEIRFKNCPLRFVLTREFRKSPADSINVEVYGQLVRNGAELEFHVLDLKPRESDTELLKLRRALVDSSRPEELFELAAWTRQRGQFYEDAELTAIADRYYREALTIAHEHLRPGDVEGLRELAAKAREVGVEEGLALRYLHEAIRLEWKAAQESGNGDFRGVLGRIRRELPGSDTPLPKDRLSIREDYLEAPLAVFRVADSRARSLLARAFFLEVALADILRSAEESGRNGYQIADRIERELPELKPIAEEYRTKELAYLTARAGRLSRSEVLELAQRYRGREQTDQAESALRTWLTAQERRARQSGPAEMMDLGDEYINLLRDESSAARLYQLAYSQNPQLKAARQWLSSHGYHLQGARWIKPGESEDEADASMQAAIQEGRVQVGMTAAQVLQTLGSRPSSAVRMAASGEVSEFWVFADHGVTVQLERKNSSTTAIVVAIGTVD